MTKHRINTANGYIEFTTRGAAEAWRDVHAPGATITAIDMPTPEPERWRVSKDTMLGRVEAAGMIPAAMAAIGSMPEQTQFLWTNFAWFWSDNAQLVAMCNALGLDPAVILARDEFLA